jgi:hypothetical protein
VLPRPGGELRAEHRDVRVRNPGEVAQVPRGQPPLDPGERRGQRARRAVRRLRGGPGQRRAARGEQVVTGRGAGEMVGAQRGQRRHPPGERAVPHREVTRGERPAGERAYVRVDHGRPRRRRRPRGGRGRRIGRASGEHRHAERGDEQRVAIHCGEPATALP